MIREANIIKAIEVIRDNNSATTTLLQRKLGWSFAMSVSILYELVELGIISDKVGAKPRTIYLKTNHN